MGGPFKCGLCEDRSFPFKARLIEHLNKEHKLKGKAKIAQLFEQWNLPTTEPIVEKPCKFCGSKFPHRKLAGHYKECPQRGAAAAESAPEDAEAEMGDGGKREQFRRYLVGQKFGRETIRVHLKAFDEWVEYCDGEDNLMSLEYLLSDFIDTLPNISRKKEVLNAYKQLVRFEHLENEDEDEGEEGERYPIITRELDEETGKVVDVKKAFHGRSVFQSSVQEDDGQSMGQGPRVRAQPNLYQSGPLRSNIPKAKPSKRPNLLPMDVQPSTSSTQQEVKPSTSRGQQQLASGAMRVVGRSGQVVRIPLGNPQGPRDSNTGAIPKRTPVVVLNRIRGGSVPETPSPGTSRPQMPPMTPAGAVAPPATPSPGTPRPLVISLTPAAATPRLDMPSLEESF